MIEGAKSCPSYPDWLENFDPSWSESFALQNGFFSDTLKENYVIYLRSKSWK